MQIADAAYTKKLAIHLFFGVSFAFFEGMASAVQSTSLLSFAVAKTFSKQDKERTASLWTWEKFSSHLPRLDDCDIIDRKWIPVRTELPEKLWCKVKERFLDSLLATFGAYDQKDTFSMLSSCSSLDREEQIKMVINSILMVLCVGAKKKLRLEVIVDKLVTKSHQKQGLYPFSRSDAILGDGEVVVEVKLNHRLGNDSVAQLLLAMLALGDKLPFGILTCSEFWTFFHTGNKGIKVSKAYRVSDWESLRVVCEIIWGFLWKRNE